MKTIAQKITKVPQLLIASAFLFAGQAASAATFTTFTDELAWQTAVGTFSLENFEGYSVGDQISDLPALGLDFATLDGGGKPQIYQHPVANGPHGVKHLGNFPNGINAINRFDDIVMNVKSGVILKGLGFWNGDGQADTFFATAFDKDDNVLGTIGAFKANFAGFTTDMAIAKIVFDGSTGDGWNHLDGLQTSTTSVTAPVPIPATALLLCSAVAGLGFARKKHQKA